MISLWEIELDLVSGYRSELTSFLCGDRKMLGFSVCIETNVIFYVGAPKLSGFQRGDRIDMMSVVASKLS